MASPPDHVSEASTRDSNDKAMHEDAMSISSGRPASPYDPTPLLALHDFLDQKVPIYTHSYSRGMGTLVEEDEEEDSEDEVVISPMNNRQELGRNESTTNQPQEEARDQQKLSRPKLVTTLRYQETNYVPLRQTNQDQPPQPMSRSRSSPADIPQTCPPRRPNWQTIRYQSVPGRTNKDKLAAWIEGWSEDIGQLGDEAYCACADSTACPREHDTPTASKMKRRSLSRILRPTPKREIERTTRSWTRFPTMISGKIAVLAPT